MYNFILFCALCIITALFGYCSCMRDIFKPKEWTYFVFAQQWPPAACLNVPHGKCYIPRVVDDWSIHGLWPTSDKGYPSFCNNSWPFNPGPLKSILPALEAKWPNIYADTSQNSFWKHEWQKHGTCAASLQNFDSELRYFTRSLQLHDSLNIYDFIRKAGIKPDSERPVLVHYIRNAIMLHVKKEIKLFCKNHKDYDYPIITSMYICLDKNEQVIDCDKIDEPECNKTHVLYLPFNYTTSEERMYDGKVFHY